MANFRKKETRERYKAVIDSGGLNNGCHICGALAVAEFEQWRVIKNDFPYDLIATKHDMLVTKRHITEFELNSEEKAELDILKKDYINQSYDFIMEATVKTKTIPAHAHLHLIVVKEDIKE